MRNSKPVISMLLFVVTFMVIVFTTESWAQSQPRLRDRLWNIRDRLSSGAYTAIFGSQRSTRKIEAQYQEQGGLDPVYKQASNPWGPLAIQPCSTPPCLDSSDTLVNDRNQDSGSALNGWTQNETSIAAFANNVVMGWNDTGYRQAGISGQGFGRSTDGGRTWQDRGELSPTNDPDPLFPRADPWLDVDTAGNFYYSSIIINSLGSSAGLGVSKSTDGGLTFSVPRKAVGPTNGIPFYDKEALAVDKSTGLQTSGYIYLSYTSFVNGLNDGTSRIELVRSTDGGTG